MTPDPDDIGEDDFGLGAVLHVFKRALPTLRSQAEQGNALAQFSLGKAYLCGLGMSVDLPRALQWITKSADQGVIAAQAELGRMYANGDGVSHDFHRAAYWLKLATLGDSPYAHYVLGRMYMSGQGVETNHKRALELLQRACARGVIHAHYHLGQAYLRGLGTARDAKCALEHFNAGWAGCPDCRCAFGTMYALGDGVPVDREKALTSLYVGGKTGHIMSLITLEALFPDEPKRPKLDPQHLRDAAPIIAELRERANEK